MAFGRSIAALAQRVFAQAWEQLGLIYEKEQAYKDGKIRENTARMQWHWTSFMQVTMTTRWVTQCSDTVLGEQKKEPGRCNSL